MEGPAQNPPAGVPDRASQAGEVRARWAWAERTVWTERMLTALENGVKGDVWFRLMDKVFSLRNLRAAWAKVRANGGSAGVDHVTVAMFEQRLEDNLTALHEELRTKTYRPQAVRRVYIPKPGSKEKRPLGIPTVRDRVVQAALRHVLEPIFERDFAAQSYGFRPGRGCKDALRRVNALLMAGYRYVVDADLKSYFDTIPHDRLMRLIRAKVADGSVLKWVEAFLNQGVLDTMRDWTPEEGTPQGAVISPLLANIYLDGLDHALAQAGYELVRYADDFVILCRSQAEAEAALALVQTWTAAAGLTLHPTKTRLVNLSHRGEGFDFLGYHFARTCRRGHLAHWPREKSLRKLKDAIRAKTPRKNGRSLPAIIADVNRTLRGWFEYFKHSCAPPLDRLDGWIRMRLRSILRKRSKRCGCGRGTDHQRWPNVFFARQGLFSLVMARTLVVQSAQAATH